MCVEPHVLIGSLVEYERQAETQLVTSELAQCYLWEHAAICQLLRHPSALPLPREMKQVLELLPGLGTPHRDQDLIKQSVITSHRPNHPPAHGCLQPSLFPSLVSLHSSCRLTQLGQFWLCCPCKA